MNFAALRLKHLFTQVTVVDHRNRLRVDVVDAGVEIVGAGVGIKALLHVLPPWGGPDDPWLFWIAETAVKRAMCSTPVSPKVLLPGEDRLVIV